MDEYNQMSISEQAATLENWKILCLDRTYPEKYKAMYELFRDRVSKHEAIK